jgi:hypothetical protein
MTYLTKIIIIIICQQLLLSLPTKLSKRICYSVFYFIFIFKKEVTCYYFHVVTILQYWIETCTKCLAYLLIDSVQSPIYYKTYIFLITLESKSRRVASFKPIKCKIKCLTPASIYFLIPCRIFSGVPTVMPPTRY